MNKRIEEYEHEWFSKTMTDEEKRNRIHEVALQHDTSAVILEDFSYPKGLVGWVSEDGKHVKCVYNSKLMIEDLMDSNPDWSHTDAVEWFWLNTYRGCPYCYSLEADAPAPIILTENFSKKLVVGVIGTQNTGKSTFINDVINKYKDTCKKFETVGCDYRKKIEEAGLKINRNGNFESQKIILDTLIDQLKEIERRESGNFITDRSPIDAYVYTVYLYRHNQDLGITENDLHEMFEKVRRSISIYDKIVFLDLDACKNVEVVNDKFRDTDIYYRKEIDSIFKETIDELKEDYEDKFVWTVFGTRRKRLEKFEEVLDEIDIMYCESDSDVSE